MASNLQSYTDAACDKFSTQFQPWPDSCSAPAPVLGLELTCEICGASMMHADLWQHHGLTITATCLIASSPQAHPDSTRSSLQRNPMCSTFYSLGSAPMKLLRKCEKVVSFSGRWHQRRKNTSHSSRDPAWGAKAYEKARAKGSENLKKHSQSLFKPHKMLFVDSNVQQHL